MPGIDSRILMSIRMVIRIMTGRMLNRVMPRKDGARISELRIEPAIASVICNEWLLKLAVIYILITLIKQAIFFIDVNEK